VKSYPEYRNRKVSGKVTVLQMYGHVTEICNNTLLFPECDDDVSSDEDVD
jgi:hypothetical protein